MSDQKRREIILARVVERLDTRINRLVAIRNKFQDMVEILQAEADKEVDHETDPT